MIYLELFLGFLKVGCFSFGGAYGAIPIIRDTVLSYGWLDDEALSYMIAVSESTPGPIMVNLATYVGSSQAGLPGAALATAAVVLPSFAVILLAVAALATLLKNRYVQAAMKGLKPCIAGIILATGIYMAADNVASVKTGMSIRAEAAVITGVLAAVMLGARYILKKKISPVMLIAISAVLGIIIYGG